MSRDQFLVKIGIEYKCGTTHKYRTELAFFFLLLNHNYTGCGNFLVRSFIFLQGRDIGVHYPAGAGVNPHSIVRIRHPANFAIRYDLSAGSF